jgi:hypothetical protein
MEIKKHQFLQINDSSGYWMTNFKYGRNTLK